MVEKILNNTTPYGKIRASHEGSLHSSTLKLLSRNKANNKYFYNDIDNIVVFHIVLAWIIQTILYYFVTLQFLFHFSPL